MELPVYLDNQATTRTDPRVLTAMLPFFTTSYGNAASQGHRFGWDALDAVERAREQVASLIGGRPKEIVFTSGATEANNLAIKGTAWGRKDLTGHLVTAVTEHRAVLAPMRRLAQEGWGLTILPVDHFGRVDSDAVARAITDDTVLVSIMTANNEVGTLAPITEIGRICRERGVLFHTDATQAVGKVPLDVVAGSVDLLSLSAHKFHGPKGIGALYVCRGDRSARLVPLLEGGDQERGLRSGTLPVPLIVGLGAAAEIAARERAAEAARLGYLRDRLWVALEAGAAPVVRNGTADQGLPGNLNVSFPGVNGEALMMKLRDVAVSSGAACSSAHPEVSHVLRAMGVPAALARASIRFGLSRFTTEEEIDFAAAYVGRIVQDLRPLIPA